MRRFAVLLLTLTACASGPHVYADEQPEGLPKSARAHCRSWAGEVAKEAGGQGLNDKVAACLDALLRVDCADEMARVASKLEAEGKADAAFFFRFPGAWEPADVHQQAMEVANGACLTGGTAMFIASQLLHGIRSQHGGRIPWASFGAPSSGGLCRTGCK